VLRKKNIDLSSVKYGNDSFFLSFTHNAKGRKNLTIIEHVFYFIIHFSCQNLSSIHAFVLHMNGFKVDTDYIPELGFFPLEI